MIILIILVLILLILILAIGFMIGGRSDLPPASNLSSIGGQRNRQTLASADNSNRTTPLQVIQSRPSTSVKSLTHQTLTQRVEPDPVVIQPTVQKTTFVKSKNPTITIKPSLVVQIKPIITPQQTVVIKPREAMMVEPSTYPVAVVSPSQAVTVEPPPRGAWDERGWEKQTDNRREIYEGYYQVGNRRFRGRIEARNRGRNVSAYIYDPPPEIKRHAHGACFQQVANGWFFLHWARPARNVDEAILYMERVLDESLNG